MFTKESFEKSVRLLSNRQSFDNIINESRSFNSHTADVSIFLSHSHYDMKLVKMARAFFESFGIKIYVDSYDYLWRNCIENKRKNPAKQVLHIYGY